MSVPKHSTVATENGKLKLGISFRAAIEFKTAKSLPKSKLIVALVTSLEQAYITAAVSCSDNLF
jgi:CxxC motif-containing protein